jgi:hypothetical protein
VSTFADAEVIRLASKEFVPVAGDDWYQRRREDAEGQFFRKVADQGPRKGQGGSTRQGIYILTATGKLLAYRNHRDPAVMRALLKEGLRKYQQLPADERSPGAVQVPPLNRTDPRYSRTPPKGGLIVNVFTRILDRQEDGSFCRGTCPTQGADRAAHDHLWLTEAEWRSLLPAEPQPGKSVAVPRRLLMRILRFHLMDNTRGEPPPWSVRDVREGGLTLTVEEASPAGMALQLTGRALLASSADSKQAKRGFDAHLLGYLHYDAAKNVMDRFDLIAVGEHWGQGTFTAGARPGRTPLGVAFSLARGDTPADQVPPQESRSLRGYYEAERE